MGSHQGRSALVEQGKTNAGLQIDIMGELAALIERIKSRGLVGMTLLSGPSGQQLKHSGYFRSQFKLARDRAEKRAAELGIVFTSFNSAIFGPKALRIWKA